MLRPLQSIWAASGHNQLLWGIVVPALSAIGPILYLTIAGHQPTAARSEGV
ncbi:MAG: hypothetical protein ACXWH0_01390 [Acidimicrobiia bacterium]